MDKRTFYSKSTGLTISPPHMKGVFKNVDGEDKRVGETIIQFIPMGANRVNGAVGGEFGYYVTENPKEIEYLERRSAETGDVFGPQEYNRLSTPPEIRAEAANRTIEEQNRLIAQLQSQVAAQSSTGKSEPANTK